MIVVGALVLLTWVACSRDTGVEFDARVAALHENARRQPESIENWVELGRACLDLRDDTEDPAFLPMAQDALVRALDLDAAHVPTLIQLARLRQAQHQFDTSRKLAYAAVARDPGSPEAWGLMADAYFETGDYAAADSCYATMHVLDSGFESLRRLARVTALTGEYEIAISYIDRAVNNAPLWEVDARRLAAARVEQGELFYSHGFVEAAARGAQQALDLQPESLGALSLRAKALELIEPGGRAEDTYRQLIRLSPHPRYKSWLARYYAGRGEQQRADSLVAVARREFEELAGRYPAVVNRDRVEFMLAWSIDPETALRLATREIRRRKDIRGYEILAQAYYANGKYELAWSSMALALRKGARHPRLLYHAAVIARAAGKADKAETYLKLAVDANPIVEKIYGMP